MSSRWNKIKELDNKITSLENRSKKQNMKINHLLLTIKNSKIPDLYQFVVKDVCNKARERILKQEEDLFMKNAIEEDILRREELRRRAKIRNSLNDSYVIINKRPSIWNLIKYAIKYPQRKKNIYYYK